MAERDLLVRILGDDRDLQRALKNTERGVQQIDGRMAAFGKNVKGAFATAGISIGTAAVFAELSNSIEAASDLNEQLARTEVVFGESADSIKDWSRDTATAMGIARREALAAAGTFGGLFQTVGVDQRNAAEFSKVIVKLASDLASLQNTNPEDALAALRSGLAGEIEPLRRFNIFLSEAAVQQRALADTGKANVAALSQQEKILARYNIILEQGAVANDNFTDTAGELANQQRILRAQIDDLEASLGTLLIPKLTELVGTLNDATGAAIELVDILRDLKELAPIEIPVDIPINVIQAGRSTGGLRDLAEGIANQIRDAVVSGISAGTQPFEDLAARLRGEGGRGFTLFPASVDTRGTSTKDAADKAEETATKAENDGKRALGAQKRAQKAWNEFVKGMGLKLDRAQLTEGINDDIAVLRELEQAILRQIEREGRTFKLVNQLTQTRLQINALVRRQADDARQAGIEAFNATVDALNLDLEMAQATKSLADDQVALRAIEQAILKRIAAEGQTTDLLRQLFNVRQEQADIARQIAEQKRTQRQDNQFEALGLTEEGDRPTPGVGALRRRLTNLREQVKGTTLDTAKTRRELDRIQKVLSGKFGAVGKEVRAAILQMFNDISSAFEEGNSKVGPLTKAEGLNTKKILEGLGLSEQETNELRSRLSSINSGGMQLAPSSRSTQTSGGGGSAGTPFVIDLHATLEVDGQKMATTVTKQQQKTRRRNPQQKRGPNRHR